MLGGAFGLVTRQAEPNRTEPIDSVQLRGYSVRFGSAIKFLKFS